MIPTSHKTDTSSTHDCASKEEACITHPNRNSRSSVSIAVAVASSMSLCRDPAACEAGQQWGMGAQTTPERGKREAVGGVMHLAAAGRIKLQGGSDTYPPGAGPVMDPLLGPGKLPTWLGASGQAL